MHEIDLLSIFWTFIEPTGGSHLCALCETAVVAFSPVGAVLWRFDTDLINDYSVAGAAVSLRLADEAPIRLDLQTGHRLADDCQRSSRVAVEFPFSEWRGITTEQLMIDAYADGKSGMIVTPLGVLPVEVLVGPRIY